MNNGEFQVFVGDLNAVWPKSFENKRKMELLFDLMRSVTMEQARKIFVTLAMDCNAPPSLNKVNEAIQKVLGIGYVAKDRNEFIQRVQAGIIWCEFCAATGIVDIINRKQDGKDGAEKGAMLCGHCVAAKMLGMQRDGMPEYFDLLTPVWVEPQKHGPKSPYLLNDDDKAYNAKIIRGFLVELGKKGNLDGIDRYITRYRKEREARKTIKTTLEPPRVV